MKFLYALLVVLLVALLLTPAAAAEELGLPSTMPAKVGMSKARLERFAQHLEGDIESGRLAGATLAVARRGKLAYFKALGWANIENQQPMARDTIFRIHSMTKPIASVAAMILLEEGKLKLTDPVANYIPEFAALKVFVEDAAEEAEELVAPSTTMTVQHLMAHVSGMNGMGYEADPVSQMPEAVELYSGNPNLAEFVQRLARIPLVRHPGEEFIYGPSTDVLARVIEVASQQPFDDFLAERILNPLGMKDTHFIVPQEKRRRFATVYETVADTGKLAPYTVAEHEARWQPGYRFRSGGGGLASTTADYLRFAQMLLNRGELDGVRILAPKTIDLMTTPLVKSQDSDFLQAVAAGYGFGLGFAVLDDLAAGGKPGSLGEYFWAGAADTYFFIDPTEELIGLLMTQHYPAGTYQLREELQTFTYQAILD